MPQLPSFTSSISVWNCSCTISAAGIDESQLPGGRTVIKFTFTGLTQFANWWIVLEANGETEGQQIKNVLPLVELIDDAVIAGAQPVLRPPLSRWCEYPVGREPTS